MKKRRCLITNFEEGHQEGIFHLFGSKVKVFHKDTILQQTVAIVETSDGLVHEVLPSNLKFI